MRIHYSTVHHTTSASMRTLDTGHTSVYSRYWPDPPTVCVCPRICRCTRREGCQDQTRMKRRRGEREGQGRPGLGWVGKKNKSRQRETDRQTKQGAVVARHRERLSGAAAGVCFFLLRRPTQRTKRPAGEANRHTSWREKEKKANRERLDKTQRNQPTGTSHHNRLLSPSSTARRQCAAEDRSPSLPAAARPRSQPASLPVCPTRKRRSLAHAAHRQSITDDAACLSSVRSARWWWWPQWPTSVTHTAAQGRVQR